MKKTYSINDLYASAYNDAIYSVLDMVNETFGTDFFYFRDWEKAHDFAEKANLKFDEDGNLVK